MPVAPVQITDRPFTRAESRLIAWQLTSGQEFRQVADVAGEAVFETSVPFPVRVVPADLVRRPSVT